MGHMKNRNFVTIGSEADASGKRRTDLLRSEKTMLGLTDIEKDTGPGSVLPDEKTVCFGMFYRLMVLSVVSSIILKRQKCTKD